ncbi:MAG: hypothetical protein AB7V16_03210 [Vulcanibacillus sp.]
MKKVASFTLVMTLVFLLFSPVVLAAESDLEKVIKQVDTTNEIIDTMIDNALDKVEIFEGKEQEDMLIAKTIDLLIDQTNNIAENMIDRAANKDVEIYCELVEVEIDGQIILIDPLRIGGT